MAGLWLRFPFSFALGVLLAGRMEEILAFCRQRSWVVLSLSGLVLGLAWSGNESAGWAVPWLADVAILPFGLAACALIYRWGLFSRFWLFLGRNSLPIYLMQVPLIKYGWLMTDWRTDMLGLLATWALILGLAACVSRLQTVAASVTGARLAAAWRARPASPVSRPQK